MIPERHIPTEIRLKQLRLQAIPLELDLLAEADTEEHTDDTRGRDTVLKMDDARRDEYEASLAERYRERNESRRRLNEEMQQLQSELAEFNQQTRAWVKKRLGEKSGRYDVFLSYASGDAELAGELREGLESAGLRCFMSDKDVGAGTVWADQIHAALRRSSKMLLLITPRSVDRPWVLLETGAAWALNIPIVPALVNVVPEALVTPAAIRQARRIETIRQRGDLIRELVDASDGWA